MAKYAPFLSKSVFNFSLNNITSSKYESDIIVLRKKSKFPSNQRKSFKRCNEFTKNHNYVKMTLQLQSVSSSKFSSVENKLVLGFTGWIRNQF